MDPLSAIGLASSVAGLVSLTIEVSQLLAGYCVAVNNAHTDLVQLRQEYASLQHVLQQLEMFLRNENATCKPFQKTSVLYLSIASCSTIVEEMARELKRLSNNRAAQGLERLRWPFTEKHVRKTLETLRRYISTFQFSLSIENW
jgi:Fungal N-terminal domain of STAND proteins